MVKQQHQLFVASLALLDAIVVATAALCSWLVMRWQVSRFVEGGWPLPRQWESYFKEPLILFAVPIALTAMWMFKLYRPRRDRSLWGECGQAVKASMFTVGLMVVVLWAVGNDAVAGGRPIPSAQLLGREIEAARLQLAVFATILPVALVAHRFVFRQTLRTLRRRGKNLRHAAVIGCGRLGQITCRTISRNSWTGIHVSYFVSHHGTTTRERCLKRPVRDGLENLDETLRQNPVDAVYLALPNSHAAELPAVLRQLERHAVDVRIIPDVQPRYLPQSMTISELDGMPILSYRECPMYGVGGFAKRLLDIAGAFAGIVLLSPVLLACAVAVRASGPGPIIFKQRRVSIGGDQFKIYKFRTMRDVDAEQGIKPDRPGAAKITPAEWTTRSDPRITRVGEFMRRTSLDELPQLLNVLKGQMSLVGPRPERPELIERFREDWRGYMLRQHVKAGITGWAQVNGLRGDTSLRKRLQYDLFYVRNWSLWFDLRILIMTLYKGWTHRNAH